MTSGEYETRFKLMAPTHRCLLAVSPLAVLDVRLDVAAPLSVILSLRPGDLQAALVAVVRSLRRNISSVFHSEKIYVFMCSDRLSPNIGWEGHTLLLLDSFDKRDDAPPV